MRPDAGVRGYIIGEPIYETTASQFSMRELRGLASSHGLRDVGFTGRIDEVPGALRALDIVVHASIEPEPFGLVIAEAMACGRGAAPSMQMTVALSFDGRIGRELRAEGVATAMLGEVRLRRLHTVWRARRALATMLTQEKIDVAVCHQAWPHAVFGPVIKRAR